MRTIKEKLKEYEDLQVLIFAMFGVEPQYELIDCTDSDWTQDGGYVSYIFDGEEYDFESARSVAEEQGLTMFNAYDNGSWITAVFDNKHKKGEL